MTLSVHDVLALKSFHDVLALNIYRLMSSIFVEVDVLLTSGRTSREKSIIDV